MTNKEAIFVLKKELDGIPSDIDKSALEKAVELAIKALEKDKYSSCKPTLIRKILEDFEGWYIVNTNGNNLKVIKRCGVWRIQTEFVSAIDEYMKERGFEK